jgi:O-antigen/teichoic acid export membrane protein
MVAIFGFLALLDLGLGTALIKYIATYTSSNEFATLQKFIASAQTLYVFIGVVGVLVFIGLGYFILPVFHLSGLSRADIFLGSVLMGCTFLVNALGQIYAVAPVALQRYDIASKVSMLNVALYNIGLLLVVYLGYGLVAIFLLYFLTTSISVFFNRFFFYRLLPKLSVWPGWDPSQIREAYRFGFYAAIMNIAISSLFQLDRFIIPVFLGPAALTFYSLPGGVAQKVSGVSTSLTHILFPTVSGLVGTGEQYKIGPLYRRVVRNVSVVAATGACAFAFLAYPILRFWVSDEVAVQGWQVLILLAGTHYILALYGPLQFCLLGLGKSKFLMALSLTLAVINVFLLILFIRYFGIVGAAWAYLLGVLPVLVAGFWAEKRFFGLSGQVRFYLKLYFQLVVVGLVVYLFSRYIFTPHIHGLISLIFAVLGTVVLFPGLYFLAGFMDPDDKALLYAQVLIFSTKLKKL